MKTDVVSVQKTDSGCLVLDRNDIFSLEKQYQKDVIFDTMI